LGNIFDSLAVPREDVFSIRIRHALCFEDFEGRACHWNNAPLIVFSFSWQESDDASLQVKAIRLVIENTAPDERTQKRNRENYVNFSDLIVHTVPIRSQRLSRRNCFLSNS
jgi:hypothetical protein